MGFGLTIIFSLYLFCFQLEEKEWSQHVDGYSLVGHCTTFHSIPWAVFCTFTITFLHTFIVPCWQVSTRNGVETVYSARACLFFFLLLFHTPSGIKVGLMLSLESQCIKLYFFSKYNKSLNDWSLGEQWILFSSHLKTWRFSENKLHYSPQDQSLRVNCGLILCSYNTVLYRLHSC